MFFKPIYFLILFFACNCLAYGHETGYSGISADAAKNLIKKEKAVLVDVRTAEEYEDGHINGAISIPYTEIYDLAEKTIPDKNTKVIVYCSNGGRSIIAARRFAVLGYKNVYDLGGFRDFKDKIEK